VRQEKKKRNCLLRLVYFINQLSKAAKASFVSVVNANCHLLSHIKTFASSFKRVLSVFPNYDSFCFAGRPNYSANIQHPFMIALFGQVHGIIDSITTLLVADFLSPKHLTTL
jgi:hypothetical protein